MSYTYKMNRDQGQMYSTHIGPPVMSYKGVVHTRKHPYWGTNMSHGDNAVQVCLTDTTLCLKYG